MAEKLVGQDIIPQGLMAKITGRARYAEDFRVDGMVFAKLLSSPMPHARVSFESMPAKHWRWTVSSAS